MTPLESVCPPPRRCVAALSSDGDRRRHAREVRRVVSTASAIPPRDLAPRTQVGG